MRAGVFGLGADPLPMVWLSGVERSRLTLPILDAVRTPLFFRQDGDAVTVVYRWPTHADGMLSTDDLTGAPVVVWSPTPSELRRLKELHIDFPLCEHDVWVGGLDRFPGPCPHHLGELVGTRNPVLASRLGAEARAAWAGLIGS